MTVMGFGGWRGRGKRLSRVTRVLTLNLGQMCESVKTGSDGIEKNISVFIHPTLESRQFVTKEDSQNMTV